MILWLALFFIVIGISFVLAFRSMRDYQEIPQKSKEEYSLFLIRQTGNFNTGVLDSILTLAADKGLIISIERLFKGSKTVLTVFGPKTVLDQFSSALGLLELEDYILNLDSKDISAWEVGARNTGKFNQDSLNNVFSDFPKLEAEDQFFWQVVVGKGQTQIRAVLYSQNPARMAMLIPVFQNLQLGGLTKVPKPFSKEQMIDFYRLRSLSKDSSAPVLTAEEIMHLLRVS